MRGWPRLISAILRLWWPLSRGGHCDDTFAVRAWLAGRERRGGPCAQAGEAGFCRDLASPLSGRLCRFGDGGTDHDGLANHAACGGVRRSELVVSRVRGKDCGIIPLFRKKTRLPSHVLSFPVISCHFLSFEPRSCGSEEELAEKLGSLAPNHTNLRYAYFDARFHSNTVLQRGG